MERLKIHPETPDQRRVSKVVHGLKKGGVIVMPTDSVYCLACDLRDYKAFERMARIKGVKPSEAEFSLICNDLSHLSEFCRPISNSVFKMMKRVLPGPYTFILEANNNVPKLFKSKKRTVGIRVPDNKITQAIVSELGRPIVATSIKLDDDIREYATDPDLIEDSFKKLVDIMIDGGNGGIEPTTILDCTGSEPSLVRAGKGILEVIAD